jgi:ketosteroid isomerase-like protein
MRKHLPWLVFAAVIVAGAAVVAIAGSKQDDAAEIKALEIQTWEAWKKQDLATIKRLSTTDYLSSDGDSVTNLAEAEREVPLTILKHYQPLAELRTLQVTPDVFVVFYPIRVEGTEEGKDISGKTTVASVWVKREGQWLNVFVHEVPMQSAQP